MTQHNHQTAPTQFVQANGIRFAYRRFGKAAGVPLVFNQHFTGTMDHWDPAVTDGFAKDREVILFNNAGVSSSVRRGADDDRGDGRQRCRLHQGARTDQVDVLGFSIGGLVAQEIALRRPTWFAADAWWHRPARRRGMATYAKAQRSSAAPMTGRIISGFRVHFTPSASSQAAGREFLKRFVRAEDRDPEVNEKVAPPRSRRSANGARRGKAFDVSEVDPPADTGCQRRQGRDHYSAIRSSCSSTCPTPS